ncbi:MAG TPA: hypothetical protein DCG12_02105 [Planctomycetaceae bacterium]|nr:hypothetical protein [Planctomycetaceae bacterium]
MASYYVDPSIDSDSGAGTIGDPYGDLQYALDSIYRDTTNGDRINIKSGTAEILEDELDITTYGTPSFGAGLYFAGYTSTEGDGGVGEIDGDAYGFSVWNKTSVEGIVWDSLIIGNTDTADILYMDRMCEVRNCKIYGTSGNGVRGQVGHWRNWYDDIGSAGVTGSPQGVVDCLFTNGSTNSFTVAVQGSFVTRSCFKLSGTSTGVGDGTIIVNNSFHTTGTGNAVDTRSIFSYHYVGNLVQGFTDGLQYDQTTEMTPGSYHDNAFYDCTNNVTSADFNGAGYNSGNETLSSNLFDLSGSITSFADRLTYFNPVDQGNVYTGMSGGLVKGAVQPTSGGGGIQIARGMHGGMRG